MNAAPDMIVAGLKMLAALGGVLVLILMLLHGLRKMSGGRILVGGTKHIKVIERHPLGVKKSIALVQVPGKLLILGVCADRINILDKIDEKIVSPPEEKKAVSSFAPLLNDKLKQTDDDVREGE